MSDHDIQQELEDRLTDQALREATDQEAPPDRAEEIMSKLESNVQPSDHQTASRVPWRGLAIAACLLVAVGVGALVFGPSQQPSEYYKQDDVAVIDRSESMKETEEVFYDDANAKFDPTSSVSNGDSGAVPADQPVVTAGEPVAPPQAPQADPKEPQQAAPHRPEATTGKKNPRDMLNKLKRAPKPGRHIGRISQQQQGQGKGQGQGGPQFGGAVEAKDTDGEGKGPGQSGDNYARIIENPFHAVSDQPLSTFSIDVDTASYSNVRRMLTDENHPHLPPPDAVRIEELINYFPYDDAGPDGDVPFASRTEVAECPWNPKHQLVRIGLKGVEIPNDQRPPANLVFLLDVSGSMNNPLKLPLLKASFKMLVDYLKADDKVAIVVYAGAAGLVLDSTPGDQKPNIVNALDQLRAGGSTNGGQGIQLAYNIAQDNFIKGGINRIILATDGDFNVGTTSQGDLHRLIQEKAKSGVFLTTLGFGYGNLKDDTLEMLADKGNGNYAYIDTILEARKVLIEEMGSTLITVAKDVKIQVEFNPKHVGAYRLIGYENRLLAAQDFNDDKKDAGEIGAGHTVTALYEIVPAGKEEEVAGDVDDLEFQKSGLTPKANSDMLMLLKLRYKQPDGDTSKLLKFPVKTSDKHFGKASQDFQFASAVAAFGMLLRNSDYKADANYDLVLELAQAAVDQKNRKHSYRLEFMELVKAAKQLSGE